MLNFLKNLTAAKPAAPKADKPAEGSCGSEKNVETRKEDKGGCCGGHCH
jgi:hypothetical protein